MNKLFTLMLLGLSVGLGNFAASVAIGLSGVNKTVRVRLVVIFGLFETGMPIVGLIIGRHIAGELGGRANIIGGVLLGLTGLYVLRGATKKSDEIKAKQASSQNLGKLILAGLALSVDNLIVGFSLGTYREPLLLTALVIGITSVALALLGLELGSRLNSKVEQYSELLSGLILILVGIAIGFKIL